MLWNEPTGPDFVLEVTSASRRRDDERRKRAVYAALGVREYFLHGPRAEYLTPPLQGFRLQDGAYRQLPEVTVLPRRAVADTSGYRVSRPLPVPNSNPPADGRAVSPPSAVPRSAPG